MDNKEIIQEVLFNYTLMTESEIIKICKVLPNKIIRWLGAHHPDNRTRKLFFEMTGIVIGKDSVINQNFIVSDGYSHLLTIGERVAIGPNVTVICESAPNNSRLVTNPYVKEKLLCSQKVIIEDDVWIGANVTILPGVTLGTSSIIGAGSVVTKNINPFSIVAGVPAVTVRNLV